MNTFSVGEALKVGWEKTKSNFLLWVAMLATTVVINMIISWFQDQAGDGVVTLIIGLIGYVVGATIELGILAVALQLIDNRPATYTDIFSMYPYVGRFLIATILGGFMIVLGLIVFIIPGIYIALRLSQTGFIIADWKLSAIPALKKSWEITRGQTLQLFFLCLVIMVLNVAGAIFFLIGLVITIPVSTMAMAYVYRKLAPGAALTPIPVDDIAPLTVPA